MTRTTGTNSLTGITSITGTPSAPTPYARLVGFVLLLAVLFGAAYGVGTLVGPVAPGLHPSSTPDEGRSPDGGGSGGGHGHMGGH